MGAGLLARAAAITSQNIADTFSTGRVEYSDADKNSYPLLSGTVVNVDDANYSCVVCTDFGQMLGDVKWSSPSFTCTNGAGAYSMPEIKSRVLLARVYGGNWYIIGFLPTPEVNNGGSNVNGRKAIQQGDKIISTAAGNSIEIKKNGELIHLKNTQNCEMILESTQNKIAQLCQRYVLRTDAGFITMTSTASGPDQGNTLTDMYFEQKVPSGQSVDSHPKFVRLSIGTTKDIPGRPSHLGFPTAPGMAAGDVILYLNVCDNFKLTVDTSGNIKMVGKNLWQEFTDGVERISGTQISDYAVNDINHLVQTAPVGGDLGGDSGSSSAYSGLAGFLGALSADAKANAFNVAEGAPGSSFDPGRSRRGMGGNGGYGGRGGYGGDDAPGGFKDSGTPTPYTPLGGNPTAIDKLIDYTARNEGGGKYDAWTGNDNGHGVSFGLVQFNQEVGSLPQLMKDMHAKNPEKFNQIFGANAANMTNERFVRTANLNDPTIKAQMRQAGQDPEFQQVQRDLAARTYMANSTRICEKYNLPSERSRAMFFDASVQYGEGGCREMIAKAARGGGSEQEILTRFAAMADTHKYDNNRRHRILNDPNLSSGPMPS